MKFKNKTGYFLKNTDQYELSRNLPANITEDDFTFCVSIKVDWNKMKHDNLTKNGGIICKSGMHLGLIAIKTADNQLINATAWYSVNGENRPVDISFVVNKDEKVLNLAFIYEKEAKRITFIKNGQRKSATFDGELIDYNHSWIWIGCSNGFDACNEEHRNFFSGDINLVGIFNKALGDDIVGEFFENKKLEDNKAHSVVMFSDFTEHTPYKIRDQSGCGNHLMKYNKGWF